MPPDKNVPTPAEAVENEQQIPELVTGLRAFAYWALAGFFFAIAMLGVVLPGLPTTPFLLLMAYFLIRVSPAMHARALRWPVVGGPLRDWRDKGGVTIHVKRLAVSMVLVLVGATLLFSTVAWYVKAVIGLAAAYGISVVLRLKTVE